MTAISTVTNVHPDDPAMLGYPPTLPLEIVLQTAPLPKIFEAYGLTKEDFTRLKQDPAFMADLKRYSEELKRDGMSFKMKARLQAEELLKTSWKLIHSSNDDVSPTVKADLIKFTVRAAGLDGSKDQAANTGGTGLNIQINLG